MYDTPLCSTSWNAMILVAQNEKDNHKLNVDIIAKCSLNRCFRSSTYTGQRGQRTS